MPSTPDTPVFYTLPARRLTEGLSTNDGQDIIDVSMIEDHVHATVYTPRPDDPELDEANRLEPETRVHHADEDVDLAVFVDTRLDGRDLTD